MILLPAALGERNTGAGPDLRPSSLPSTCGYCIVALSPHSRLLLAPELRWILLTACSVTSAELLDSPSLCLWTESLQSVAFSHPPLCLGQFQRDARFLQTPELWPRAPKQVHEGGHTLTSLPFPVGSAAHPPPGCPAAPPKILLISACYPLHPGKEKPFSVGS